MLSLAVFSSFAFDLIRGFGGYDQWGVSVYAMSMLSITPYIPGVVAMVAVNTTWMSFSAKALLSRPAITGNSGIFLSVTIPFIITSFVLIFCAGISYEAYLICYRFILVTWGALLMLLVLCASITGYRNVSRLTGMVDQKFNRNQLIRAHAALAVLLGSAVLIIIFHITFFPQIDSSPIWYLFVYACYRAVYFLILFGGAIYAWYGAIHWQNSHSSSASGGSKSSTRQLHSTDHSRPASKISGYHRSYQAPTSISHTNPHDDLDDSDASVEEDQRPDVDRHDTAENNDEEAARETAQPQKKKKRKVKKQGKKIQNSKEDGQSFDDVNSRRAEPPSIIEANVSNQNNEDNRSEDSSS